MDSEQEASDCEIEDAEPPKGAAYLNARVLKRMNTHNKKPSEQQTTTKEITKEKDGLRPAHQPKNTVSHPYLNILVQMQNNGKKPSSIHFVSKSLQLMNRETDLNNPEAVKKWIAQRQVSTGYKRNLYLAYNKYAQYYNIAWEKPNYRQQDKPIRIPTRERLHKLISSAGKVLSIRLQLSMETGLRPIELCNLLVKDVDLEQRIIYPTTAKYGAGRSLRISDNLAKRINGYIMHACI